MLFFIFNFYSIINTKLKAGDYMKTKDTENFVQLHRVIKEISSSDITPEFLEKYVFGFYYEYTF